MSKILDQRFIFVREAGHLALQDCQAARNERPLYVDTSAVLQELGNGPDFLKKAIEGRSKQKKMSIVDATMGLGRDTFRLIALGHQVAAFERHPMIHRLIKDALESANEQVNAVFEQAGFIYQHGDSLQLLQRLAEERSIDVVYMDPMYGESKKKQTLPGKVMRLFRSVVTGAANEVDVLHLARQLANNVWLSSGL